MLNGRQLRALFQKFNGQYFGGKLPVYSLRSVDRMTWLGESGCCYKKRKLIKVNRGLSGEEATSTLLHEMAHAATSGHHGMPWKREMIRLREAGAPLVSSDLNVDLADWDGKRVSRQRFRGVIQDALMDAPNITSSVAVRWFVSSYGGAGSVAEFLRKYPWAGTVFKQEKKSSAEELERAAEFARQRAARLHCSVAE
jgi:SprT-like family